MERMFGLPLWIRLVALVALVSIDQTAVRGEPVVPGSGVKITKVGDDFEDPTWSYRLNLPKSSSNIDENTRTPSGVSANNRWYEGAMRGQPDVIQRVATPEGGLPGSKGSMLMRTLQSGVPGSPSGQNQQDDLIVNVSGLLGGDISVSRTPSAVVRVYLPPFDQWEPRTGNSFGFRSAVVTHTYGKSRSRWSGKKQETYWPGMFIHLNSKADGVHKEDSAMLIIRAGQAGQDIAGPAITQTGWWTLGMSFTPDGQVHYFARPGVDNLTAKDHIGSYYPYGYQAEQFSTFFFNVVNRDDGRSWSTSWIIDDPTLYVGQK